MEDTARFLDNGREPWAGTFARTSYWHESHLSGNEERDTLSQVSIGGDPESFSLDKTTYQGTGTGKRSIQEAVAVALGRQRMIE